LTDIKIIDNEFATLVYHEDEKIVHHTFHKPIGGDDFRDVLNKGTDALKKYGAIKWLSDDRGNSALSDEDTAWSKENWFPRALKAGWQYWALVVPQDVRARMNLKEFVDMYYSQGLHIMVFTAPEEAREWLNDIDKK
jgi:hypothetical protein